MKKRNNLNDHADTHKTSRTLLKNFEGSSQILKEQSGEKVILMCLHSTPISNNLKILKPPYLKKKLRVLWVHAIFERENEKVHDSGFACSYGV